MMSERTGFWSPRTSTVDWCEPNYVYTPYVAELWNTLSSLAVVLMGVVGLALSWRYGYRRRFWLSFALVLAVGCGSVAFHGTQRQEGQALDELPMVYATQLWTLIAVETAHDGFGPSMRFPWLAWALCAYCLLFTAGYFLLGSAAFLFFVALYIGGVALLVATSLSLYTRVGAAARRVGLASNIIYPAGFLFLWLPDNLVCELVQPYNFHAIFHLTSTLGPWCGLTFLIYAHHALSREHALKKEAATASSKLIDVKVCSACEEPEAELRYFMLVPYVALRTSGPRK